MIPRGQAPRNQTLLLAGSGRLARHLSFDFKNLGLNFKTWDRSSEISLAEAAVGCDRVLLAVSDSAIENLAKSLPVETTIVHFSGALRLPGTLCAHPLMTFSHELYEPDFYRSIHYTVTGAADLEEVIPGMPNSFSFLPSAQKGLYHALCVLGGNFPMLLWQKMEDDLLKLGVPESAIRTYIAKVSSNYLTQGPSAVTGPLIRKDKVTIEKNLQALEGDPWQSVYQSVREALDEHS